MNSQYIQVKQLLQRIEVLEIIKKIEDFRRIDFRTIDDESLQREIIKTISVDVDGIDQAILFPRLGVYPPKTRFYRVRKLNPSDHYVPLKAMTYEQDAWNPPPEIISRRGRLNQIHESLLYTSPHNPSVAVEELKIKEGEIFCLIVYEATSDIKVSMIGLWADLPELNEEENLKLRIISNFLNDEFTRDVGEGTEFLYRTSEIIAKSYFDLPPKVVQDAWCYASTVSKTSVNVCFRPESARELLELIGVQVCTVKGTNGNFQFHCQAIASGFDKDEKFRYYSVDSDVCKEKFPEIILNQSVTG